MQARGPQNFFVGIDRDLELLCKISCRQAVVSMFVTEEHRRQISGKDPFIEQCSTKDRQAQTRVKQQLDLFSLEEKSIA